MGYALHIILQDQKTDSNRIDGQHWTVKNKRRKSLKDEIHFKTIGLKPPMPLSSFKLTIIRECPGKNFLDYDNMITSFKGILDGLKNAKIIAGDSWKYINQVNYFAHQMKSDEIQIRVIVEDTSQE